MVNFSFIKTLSICLKVITIPLVITLLFTMTLTSCDYSDARLMFINNWNKPVSIEYANDTIPEDEESIDYYMANSINPGITKTLFKRGSRDAWIEFVMQSKDLQLTIFVYDPDTLTKYKDMELINNNRKYIDRISLTLDELNKSDWKIKFEGPSELK